MAASICGASGGVGGALPRLDGAALAEVVSSVARRPHFALVVPKLATCAAPAPCAVMVEFWEYAAQALPAATLWLLPCDEEQAVCASLPLGGDAGVAAREGHRQRADANDAASAVAWRGPLRGFQTYAGPKNPSSLAAWVRRGAADLPEDVRWEEATAATTASEEEAAWRDIFRGEAPPPAPAPSAWAHEGLRTRLSRLAANATWALDGWAGDEATLFRGVDTRFDVEDLRAAVEAGLLVGDWAERTDVLTAGAKLSPAEPLDALASLARELDAGRTVVLQDGGARLPEVARLVGAAVEALGFQASANVYLAGPNADSALGLHTDAMPVLVGAGHG